MRPFLLAAAALAALSAMPPAQDARRVLPYPIDLPPEFQAAVANGTRTLTGRPGPKHWTHFARYRIAAELDPKAAMLTGELTVRWHNRSPAPIDQLALHLYHNMLKPGMQRTRDVANTDGVQIRSVAVDGGQVRPQIRDTRMYVRLGKAVPPDGEVELRIEWSFQVPVAGTAPRMGHEKEDVFYLGYWYPQIAVHDDVEGWVVDQFRGNGEYYMPYADYEVAFTAPAGYLVRATGELQNADETLTDKARQALQRAAETREVVHVVDQDDLRAGRATQPGKDGRLTWRFLAGNVRDVAVSAARTYLWDATHAVVKDKHGPGKDGTAMIHAVYEANSGDWVRGAEYARHTIEYMSAKVHPYPWPHMTACEGVIGGGMEYPMMTIVGGRRPAGTIAHELIHMWFPMLLGSNEKRYAWQDEGFTSFFTTLCRDDFTGQSRGPQRDIMGYIGTVRRGGDAACMRHGDSYVDANFGFASYSKTAAILHQLRGMLGDEVFFGAFRRYAADWAWKHPYPYDFFRAFADHAGMDLEGYFRTWFFETWQLDHAVGDVRAAADATVVRIDDLGRAMHPCVVEATYGDGRTERQTVPLQHWREHLTAEVRFGPGVTAVAIDPDLVTLDVQRDNNAWRAGR